MLIRESKNDAFNQEVVDLFLLGWTNINNSTPYIDAFVEVTFIIAGERFDELMSKYLVSYEPGTMFATVKASRTDLIFSEGYDPEKATDGTKFSTSEVTFYYNSDAVIVDFSEMVTDDMEVPVLLEILQYCIDQKVATPVIDLVKYNEDCKK